MKSPSLINFISCIRENHQLLSMLSDSAHWQLLVAGNKAALITAYRLGLSPLLWLQLSVHVDIISLENIQCSICISQHMAACHQKSCSFSIHCMEYKRNIVLGEKMFQRMSMATSETYLSECSAIHHDPSYHNRKSQLRLQGGNSSRILGIPGCIQQSAGFKTTTSSAMELRY